MYVINALICSHLVHRFTNYCLDTEKCIIIPNIDVDRKSTFKKASPEMLTPKCCYSAACPQLCSCSCLKGHIKIILALKSQSRTVWFSLMGDKASISFLPLNISVLWLFGPIHSCWIYAEMEMRGQNLVQGILICSQHQSIFL